MYLKKHQRRRQHFTLFWLNQDREATTGTDKKEGKLSFSRSEPAKGMIDRLQFDMTLLYLVCNLRGIAAELR
jgi:hypothetical protein